VSRVLLDEQLPHTLRRHLADFDARTVAFQGWISFRNGRLMTAAENARFDAIVTMDEGFSLQRPATAPRLCIVLIHAPTNTVETLEPLVPELIAALHALIPGSVLHVGGRP